MNEPIIIMNEDTLKAIVKGVLDDYIQRTPAASGAPQIELIAPDELCKRLGISIPTQIRMRKKKLLPFIEIGAGIRYNWQKVIETLEKQKK